MPHAQEPLGPPSNDGTDPVTPPSIPYYRMETGADATSRIVRRMLGAFEQKSVGGAAAPMWMRLVLGEVAAVHFAVLPVGWIGEWHESPKPQWVVVLSGRWFIETQSGERVEMGPGDIYWGEDIGTRAVAGNRGHRSGQVGDMPCVHLMVQFKEAAKSGVLGHQAEAAC